ncbi:SDR family oxidoreductase [Streptomyces sp. 372A]
MDRVVRASSAEGGRWSGPLPPAGGAGAVGGRHRRSSRCKRQCVPRRGRPEDVAALVALLVSSSGSFITGQSVHVDAGRLLH